jgi:hypothetical protein
VTHLKRLDTDLTWRLYEVRTLYSEDRMSTQGLCKVGVTEWLRGDTPSMV